jgi:sulfur carrier protein ThiS
MKVRVKLFGTLRQQFPAYGPDHGAEIEIPYGGKVKDLLAVLGIPRSEGDVVIMEGRILSADDTLHENATVNVLQAFHGG